MVEVIAFPDAEAFVRVFLKAELAKRGQNVPISTKVPNPRPTSFIRLSRVGGGVRDLVTDSPRILVECFGPDTVSASELAKVARALLLAASRLSDDVTKSTDGGDVAFLPDPDTNQARYQFVVQLDLRGTAI